LEWLLKDGRWRKAGGGYDDANKFMDSVDLSKFRLVAEKRQAIAKLFKDELDASNRQIAKTMGVDHQTINNDIRGESSPSNARKASDNKGSDSSNGESSPPAPVLSGVEQGARAARVGLADGEARDRVVVALGEDDILENAKKIRTDKAEHRRAELSILQQNAPELPKGKYGTIVIDPPWDMAKIERDIAPNQVAFEYPTMSEDELRDFDVPSIADDNCHVFCWTTQKFLPAALRLIEHWDFRYVLTMVWHKPGGFQPFGLPQYNCEFVLYGRRGTPSFIDTKDFPTCFQAPRREHSRKPEEFYATIKRVTSAPRIDVFSREARDGFDQFGNEADKFVEVV
jgi:N6-adenosine-specific RNA methylase IME4